ncbi:MAG: hypothetical protein SVY53_05285 [Chloroflexota bacterium]|nr:hypothetical protein [Chloroflexota bacterium]
MAIISPISSPLVSSVITGRKKKTEVQSSFPTKFTKQDEERSKELVNKQEEFQNIPDWQKPGRWLLSTKPSRWTMGKVPYGSEDILTKKFPYSMPEEELREFQSLQRQQAAAGLGPAVEDFLALKALEGTPISTREELFASLPALNRVEWSEEEEGWFTSQIKLHQGELAGELLTQPDPTDPTAVENFEDALLEELLKQQGDPRFILSRASIVRDSQAITRALQEIYGGVTPTIPEGMTDEQALELLKEITPETEIPQDELVSLSQAIQDIYIQYDKELSEVGKITEVPPPGIKQLILQPMLGPLEMLNLYNKYITRPLGYYVSRASLPIAQSHEKLPGDLDKWAAQETDLIAKYNEARNEGDNPWMAASTGFEEWDVPWYQKLLTEMAVDPATYIGIGIIPRTIGKLGRPGAAIARMDTAFAQTANVPFDAMLSKIHRLPRTPSQMALGEATRAQEAFTRTIVLQTGKHMDEVTTDEVVEVLLKTLDEGGKAGASPDMQVLYKYLMVNNPMDENEILKLSTKLGGRFTNADDVTPTAMESIHSRMEQAFFNSTRDQEEAISLILHSFGANDTMANAGIVRQYLTTKFNSPSRAFIEQQKHLTPLKISQNLKKRVNGEFLDFYGAVSKAPNAKAASKIGAERMQRGVIGSIFTYEVDKFTNSTIVKALDSWAVRPAAKLYLGFSGYTIFNVIEGGFRSMVGGAMPGQITSSRMLRNYGWVKGKPFAWEDEVGDAVGMGIIDAKEELVALKDWKSFRFWKQRVGKDLMLGEVFIRKSNQWGSVMRNSYWEKRLHHHLANIAKKDVRLSNYLTSQMNKIDSLPITPKLKTQLKRDLVTATFTPNPKSNITNLLNTVEETTLKQKEAHKIVAGIDPNSNSGTFLHDAIDSQAIFLHTDDTIKKALEIEQAHDAFLPSQIAQNFKQVKDDLIATPVKSQDDYFHMLNSVRVLSDCYQQFPTHVMETTYRLASSMKSGAEKSALWDEVLKNLDEAVEESGQVLDEIIESMKGKLPRVFRKSTKLQDQTRSLDTLIEQRRYYQSLQTELLTYRKQFFATNNKWKMKSEDWDRFYTGINEIYTRGVGKRMALRKAEWQDRINGSVFVSNPAKDFTPQQVLSTQDIGHIIGAHPNNLTQSILDNAYLQDENMFVAMVEAYAEEGGHKVTQAQIRQGYRDIWGNINIKDPQRMNSLTRKADNLEAVRLQIEMLKRTPMVSVKNRPLVENALKSIADDLSIDEGKLLNITQEAGDLATRDFYRTFPTYDNNTAVDQLMKFIYPFWGYEWQRPIWLTRLAATKPIFPMTYSHYTKYSDRGYVRVPGTDLEVNPLRGTIFMGGMWNLLQDFPEYSSDHHVASTLFDLQQRTGFYPNILISLGWNIYETRGLPEFGALTPTPLSTMWHLAEKVPGMDTHAARLRHGMGGRYWEYNVLELSTQKCQEQRQPFTGLDIWNEIQEGNIHPFADDPALEEARKSDDSTQSSRAERLLLMKQIWEDAHKDYSTNAIFIEQLGCMRYYSRPREESLEEYQAIIRDITGLTEEEQRQAWNRGYSVSQLMGRGFTPEEVELIRNTEWRLYWSGITTPIRPFVQQEYQRASREFLSNYVDLRKDISLQKRQLDLDMLNNRITFQEWKTQTDDLEGKEHNAWDTLIENNSDYVTLPRTIKDRMELYKTIGMSSYGELPPPASIYLLSDLYFSLEPEEVRDVAYDGSVYIRKDWDTFYAKRAIIDDTAEEWGISDQWQELKKSQYASPLDALQKEITDKYLRTYWNMSKFVLEGYNETEQDIIMQIIRGEYTPMEDTTDKALYSNYHRHVSEARERYRKMFPEADYWLRFFGYVESAQTEAGENLWLSRGRDLTLQPSYSHYLTDYPLFRSEDIALGRLKEDADGY